MSLINAVRRGSFLSSALKLKTKRPCQLVCIQSNVAGSSRGMLSVVQKYVEAYRRYGLKDCLRKLSYSGDIKFGYLVGEDEFGNKYFEDPTEPHGQTRYVEYKQDEYDASQIPPAWHSWMHHITDAIPGSEGQKPHAWHKNEIASVSNAPYADHVGPSGQYAENQTGFRSRGYGVGSLVTSYDEPDSEYLQPNHPLRNRSRPLFKGDLENPTVPEQRENIRDPKLE